MFNDNNTNEDRGQTLLLTAVLLSVIVLSAVVVANAGHYTSEDITEGVGVDKPDAISIADSSEPQVRQAIVKHNREDGTDFDALFNDVETGMSKSAMYSATTIDMTLESRETGDRVYGKFEPNTSDDEGEIATGLGSDTVGGVSIDMEKSTLPTNQSNAFTVELVGSDSTNKYEVYRSGGEVVVVYNDGVDEKRFSTPPNSLMLDVGVGRVDGYKMDNYDTSLSNIDVRISNSEDLPRDVRVYWSGEFLTTTSASTPNGKANINRDTGEIYGVAYNIQVKGKHTTINTDRVVTHAPTES